MFKTIDSLVSLMELLDNFEIAPVSRWSIQTIKEGIVGTFSAWEFSRFTVPKLLNCGVLALSVMLTSLFVIIPELRAYFPSGISASVTCVFVFSDSGFGSSLITGRERLVGIVIGSTYGYFAVVSFGNVYLVTALMVFWVAFSIFCFGQDSLYAAQSSLFAVSLALYNSGQDRTTSVQTVSDYLVANAIGVTVLLAVAAVFWLFSVFSVRPTLVFSMRQYLNCVKDSVSLLIKRCLEWDAQKELKLGDLEKKLLEIEVLGMFCVGCAFFFQKNFPQ